MIKKLGKLEMERAVMLTLLVATLGYFVDVFDLILFSVVRVPSLKDLGVAEADLLGTGVFLINTQMAGMLIGGIVWGMWGDKMGRVSVLFGSIMLYSLANIANGFVQDVNHYAVLRFIAGLGLAGELGAGVTLASELLPRQWRGLGTTFIASLGVAGAVFAAIVADITGWRTAYIIGGVMGLLLLVLRMQVRESTLFEALNKTDKNVKRGNFLMLLKPKRLKKYIACILVGLPIWTVLGVLVTFSPEFAKDFGMTDIPKPGTAVMIYYMGLVLGDMFSGMLSQYIQKRREAAAVFMVLTLVFIFAYIFAPHQSLQEFYGICFLLGIGTGFWTMFIQIGAEQFGTNIRSTAATSIPNMVRGSVIVGTTLFRALIPMLGVSHAGLAVTAGSVLLAMGALYTLRETFHTDLDYVER